MNFRNRLERLEQALADEGVRDWRPLLAFSVEVLGEGPGVEYASLPGLDSVLVRLPVDPDIAPIADQLDPVDHERLTAFLVARPDDFASGNTTGAKWRLGHFGEEVRRSEPALEEM